MLEHHIFHVDMDAFFAAVEQRERPELRGFPVVVGSPPDKRGVVCTASYEARQFGVRSAMPSRTAYRLCPQAVFLPVRRELYCEVSRQIMAIFERLTPVVEPVSIDEAFLDVAGFLVRHPDPPAVAKSLRRRIYEETGLTASVGVATNKFLAKIASDFRKPAGLTVVPADPAEIVTFLAPMSVSKIWGVGRVTAQTLAEAGIHIIAQLQQTPVDRLERLLGARTAAHLHELAFGRDERPVVVSREEKSISNETTFDEDCQDPQVVRQTLLELTEKVGRRLRTAQRLAGTAQIKLRFADFTTITRQQAFKPPICSDRALLDCARQLCDRELGDRAVRLIGFGVTNLIEPSLVEEAQPLLFSDRAEVYPEENGRDAELDVVVDELRQRFGSGILKRGTW
jgi:nucleotidyltransferase/DNA polymerase involved in DNA repair